MTMMDTLETAHHLEEAGFTKEQAEAVTAAIKSAVSDGLATKADLEKATGDLKLAISETAYKTVQWVIGIAIASVTLAITLSKVIP